MKKASEHLQSIATASVRSLTARLKALMLYFNAPLQVTVRQISILTSFDLPLIHTFVFRFSVLLFRCRSFTHKFVYLFVVRLRVHKSLVVSFKCLFARLLFVCKFVCTFVVHSRVCSFAFTFGWTIRSSHYPILFIVLSQLFSSLKISHRVICTKCIIVLAPERCPRESGHQPPPFI